MPGTYIQLEFDQPDAGQSEILIAILGEAGFTGFEEKQNCLLAFIPAGDYEPTPIRDIAQKLSLRYRQTIIEETNWNKLWESNFQPVIVDDFVGIRADFHSPVKNVEHEILITPKMSFGTGHHATTLMMVRQMRSIDFNAKTVLDFGTGTGILAILAEKLKAASILAIDNDEWSITNAAENISRNDCTRIKLVKSDTPGNGEFDIALANINKNIILQSLEALSNMLKPGSVLLISGLLEADGKDVSAVASSFSFIPGIKLQEKGWICMQLARF